MAEQADNNDLVWDLDAFSQRQQAVAFVMGFENNICVYSASVEQLYTNYNIFFPQEEARKLVILPNPYAPHDTFNSIPVEAISATGLNIVPGAKAKSLHLMIPFKSGKTRYRKVPLKMGLQLIRERLPAGKVFLPVLMKGDLRELDASTPCLHLHCLHLDRLTHHSALECKGIHRAIETQLRGLY